MLRWISGFIIALITVGIVLYMPLEGIYLTVVGLSMYGWWEYYRLMGGGVSLFNKISGLLICGLSTFLFLFWVKSAEDVLLILTLMLLLTFLIHFQGHHDLKERIQKMMFYYFGLMYMSLLFSYLGWVRSLDHWEFWVFLMLVCTFMSDTGGYIVGHWIGRCKLAPLLSPGKTVEGFFGGWLFALLGALVVRFIFWPQFLLAHLVFIASLIAVIGPLGDLSESLIKRGVHAKDSGNLIPGHGGLLDRVDALLFVAPVVYYFAKYFS